MRPKKALPLICALAIALCAFIPCAQSAFGAAAPDPLPPFSTYTVDSPGGTKSWDVPVSFTYVKPKMDIVYVIDTTGSMWHIRNTVAETVNSFNAELAAAGATDIWWGAAFYGDKDYDDPWYGMELPLNSYPLDKVQSKITNLKTTNGGDEPEDSLVCFMRAIDDSPWRSDSQHVVVLITDATTKVRPTYSIGAYKGTCDDAAKLANANGIVTCLMDYSKAMLPEMSSALGATEYIWKNGDELLASLRSAVIAPAGKTYTYSTAIISSKYQSDNSPSTDLPVVPSPSSFKLSGGESKSFSFNAVGANPPARYNDTTIVEIGFFVDGVRIPAATQYLNYRVNRYNVAYNANTTDTISALEPTKAYVEKSAVKVASAPTRKGYGFAGWNTKADGTGTPYAPSESFTMPANDITLYAIWQIGSNKVTYHANTTEPTSKVPAQATHVFNSTVTVADAMTREGYQFSGWNTASDGSKYPYMPAATFTMPDSDVDLYAIWKISNYPVRYFANTTDETSTVPASDRFNYRTSVTVADAMTRKGYTFLGWNTKADGTGTSYNPLSTFTMPANEVDLYAIWSMNAHKVTYNKNTADTTSAVPPVATYSFNAKVTVEGMLTREGYTFVYWSTDPSNRMRSAYNPTETFEMPDNDVDLYAIWKLNNYEVRYHSNAPGIDSPASARYDFNAPVTAEQGLTRKGYSFISWNTEEQGEGTEYRESSIFAMPASDMDLYAVWKIGSNKVVYDPNTSDSTSKLPATETYQFGSPVTIQDGITRTGYSFVDWNTANDDSGTAYQPDDGFAMPDEDVTLFATWQVNSYKVSYFANTTDKTSAIPATSEHLFKAKVTVEKGLTRKGYAFVCWNTAADRSGVDLAADAIFDMPSGDVELYAVWKSSSPDTSDGTHTTFYLTLLAISFTMLICGLAFINKKRASGR